jgi:hypothetical protein
VSDFPPGRIRDCDRRDYRGCAQSFRSGSWTFLPPAIGSSRSQRQNNDSGRSLNCTQGKGAISKGIGELYGGLGYLLSRPRHGPTGVAGARWQVARDRGGVLRSSPIACGRLDRAISVQEPRLLAAEGQSNCRFFLQNALVLSPERPGRTVDDA